MIKKWRRMLWVAGIAASLGLGAAATAQTSTFQPFKGLFGSKTAPASEQKTQETNRNTEIQVELAWLSDRTTFPYFLEAHVKGSNLEVRGYVPTKSVRDQAVSLAKLNCPLPVIDVMKEHSSLAIRPARRAPDQLKNAVETALRETFPGDKLLVQCQSDGTVQVTGSVPSLEEKLKISQSLRRLHGCTSVTNFTQLAEGGSANQAMPDAKSAKSSVGPNELGDQSGKVAPEQKRTGLFGMFAKKPPPQPQVKQTDPSSIKITNTDSPGASIQSAGTGLSKTTSPVRPGDPYESRGLVVVSTDATTNSKAASNPVTVPVFTAPKTAMAGSSISASQLKKRIEGAVPGVRNVIVTFTSKTDVRVECATRPGDDSGAIAGQILSLRELDPYKVDLQLQLPEPK